MKQTHAKKDNCDDDRELVRNAHYPNLHKKDNCDDDRKLVCNARFKGNLVQSGGNNSLKTILL